MSKSYAPLITICILILLAAGMGPGGTHAQAPAPVTVHEWGTFTTVAGPDGHPVQWLPLGGAADLPCFVEFFRSRLIKLLPAEYGAQLDYQTARTGLKGTVRMETPVLYFYAPQETEVDVSIQFSRGLFTEWYPRAQVDQLPFYENLLKTDQKLQATIAWRDVRILPDTTPDLPFGEGPSHYYAARDTDAAPIQASGQDEKFLFYRGVGGFPVPISATQTVDGRILVTNLASGPMAGVILFTNQRGRIGYRVHGVLHDEVVIDAPPLDGQLTTIRRDLEQALVGQGLYRREARAMVETWRDSWFEEGTRVFYVVPEPEVDAILPLSVQPKPAHVVRVFVGRMEVITPATVRAVEDAVVRQDRLTLARYGRLLGPIAERMLDNMTPSSERATIRSLVDATFKSYLARVGGCS